MSSARRFFCVIPLILLSALAASPTRAATVSFISWFYSSDHFVPHLHFEGPVVDGDVEQVRSVFDSHVRCGFETLPAEGGNCAVMTFGSPGGSYREGLKLAQFMRENRIATIIEDGASCYSACAFAFLGGTGYSTQSGVGVYVDRTVEPGGILGFHAPYFAPDSLDGLVAEYGLDEVLGASRDDISLMIQQLVSWNVDENVLAYIVSMGPDQTYDVVTGEDYYLTRTALPVAPMQILLPADTQPLANVCANLIATRNGDYPSAALETVGSAEIETVGVLESGEEIRGIRLGPDNPLGVTFCGLPAAQFESQGDADISLFSGAGIKGNISPMLTFFYRPEGWSSLDAGGRASRGIFQKGAMNTLFLDPVRKVAPTKPMQDYLDAEKFMTAGMIAGEATEYPVTSLSLEPQMTTPWSTIGLYQDVEIVQQVGTADLFERAKESLLEEPVTIDHQSASPSAFIYGGVDALANKAFVWMGFLVGDEAAIIRIEPRNAATDLAAQADSLYAIACSFTFKAASLTCGG